MAAEQERLRLRPSGVQWKMLEDETVVLDLQGSRYFAINETGTLIWPLLVEGATRAQLVDAVAQRYGVAEEQAGRDVDAFCAALDAEGLLQR